MVGANLPDVDALAYVFGDDVDALVFRRGWTHGILAMALLPVILAGTMLAFDRLVRLRRRPDALPARWRPLIFPAGLGVLSHPILDFLNTYGVRFLAPFSWKWAYGDALFIVDPWVWLALSLGIFFSRGRARRAARNPERPARVALLLTAAYAVAMMFSGVVGRIAVAQTGAAFQRQMVGPLPANPFERQVVLDLGDAYRSGALAFRPGPRVSLSHERDPKGAEGPLASAAARTETGRKFLSWSRFPIFRVERGPQGAARVVLQDARYPPSRDGNWASAVIPLPPAAPTSPPS
jgi:inner membrane protein